MKKCRFFKVVSFTDEKGNKLKPTLENLHVIADGYGRLPYNNVAEETFSYKVLAEDNLGNEVLEITSNIGEKSGIRISTYTPGSSASFPFTNSSLNLKELREFTLPLPPQPKTITFIMDSKGVIEIRADYDC